MKLDFVKSTIFYASAKFRKSIESPATLFHGRVLRVIGTLRYKDGKARTATAVDAGNSHEYRRVAKNKDVYFRTGRQRQ